MAPQQALRGEPASTDNAVSLDSFHRIFRTGRRVTTGWRQHRAHRDFVKAEGSQHHGFHVAATRAASDPRATAAALRRSANAAEAGWGRATITRSQAGPLARSPIAARNAVRRRRR